MTHKGRDIQTAHSFKEGQKTKGTKKDGTMRCKQGKHTW